MANNKAPVKDNINAELIKYAPKEIYKEIANVYWVESMKEMTPELSWELVIPLQKPKKTQGPAKNHRFITLLEVIWKILSKIFTNRTKNKIIEHLSQSQSAYRKFRNITDVVWDSHRWMAAKT